MNALAWWFVGGAASVAVLVLAELLARWELHRGGVYYVWSPGRRTIIRPDREALPGAEPVVHFEVNSAGERGDEPPPPGENAYRILVVGGSAAECSVLDQWTSWPGALQRVLNQPANLASLGVKRVHVGNIGKSMIDSHALEKILRAILPRYPRLDAIIVFVGASNVMHWLEAGAPVDAVPRTVSDPECFAWHPNGPFTWHPKRTALAEMARRLRLRVLRPTDEWNRAGKFMTRVRAMRVKAKPLCDTVPDPSAMLDGYEASMRNVLRTAMQYSDRVILTRQPWLDKSEYSPGEEARFWHGGFGDVFSTEVTKFCTSRAISDLMSQIDARATRVAEDVGVEHVNLRAVVESSLSDYYDQIHFTPTGAAKIAAAVAAVVVQGASSRASPTAVYAMR